MAKNTMPRNIPLEAVCDLGATQKVTDYEGFRGINSFNMNGRLCAWYRKKGDGITLSDTVTAKKYKGGYDIFDNGKKVMSVSDWKYVEEEVSELPSLSLFQNPYPEAAYFWTEYPGISYSNMKDDGFIFGFEYNGLPATLVTAKEQSGGYKCFFIQNRKCLGSWTAPDRINVIAKVSDSEHLRSMTDYGFPDFPLGLVWTSWQESAFERFNGTNSPGVPPVGQCGTFFLKKDNPFLSLGKIIPDNRDLSHQGWNTTSGSTTPGGYVLPGGLSPIDVGIGIIGEESGSTTTTEAPLMFAVGWNKVIIKDSDWHYLVTISGMKSLDYMPCNGRSFKEEGTYTCTFTSAECELYTIKWETPARTAIDYSYHEDLSNSFSKDSVHRIESCSTLFPENYSKKFGEFAVNYVKNQEYSIGHAYKKIIQLDEHELLGYTGDSVYYKNGGKIYRLHVVETDELDYSILDGNIIIFNTTDYKNAYDMTFGNVFCSSDDWNNRAQWKLKAYSENWRMLNSRLNQNWQTQRKIVGTSDQLNSVPQRIAVRTEGETTVSAPSNMEVFYIDDSYTCPEGVEYDVFFESAITSSVGSLVKQGTLSTKGFTVAKDEGMIFSEPGTDENQLNLPILGRSFETYNGTTIIKVGDFSYTALKQTMLGNLVVPVYQFLEKGYSATDYAMFAINGTLYSYYPKTNQITDSDGLFVCDTSTLVYLGYSTRAAYFYCKMDRGIYMFTGANEMQRCFAVETRTLVLAPFKDGSTSERGDTLNLPSLDLLAVNLGDGFAVLFGSQLCVVDSEERIGAGKMRLDKSRGTVQAGGYDWSLIHRDGYESVPIEFETQFYGDASGESNMVNDAVYFELTNYNGKSEGKITVQTVALVNGTVKEGAKKTISVGKSDFNKAGIARVRYQPDIQECRGFKLKVVSDFEIASMKIGCEAGALAQPKVRM